MPRHLLLTALLALSIAGCSGARSSESTVAPAEAPDRPARASADEEPAEGVEPSPPDRPARASAGDEEPAEGVEESAHDGDLVASLAGEWHLAESNAEGEIDRAISDVTGQMNVFARGIANGQIDESVNPDERVSIEAAREGIVVAIGRGHPVSLALNGPAVPTTGADDQPLRTRAILRGGRLSIEEQNDQGTRILTFQPRGDALVVTTRIRSDRLPDDIVFRLRYRRAEGGGVASR
jgi:hypothetical protein